MREVLGEVFTSMRNNKMRIGLTGFSIGWGMFILVVLLGSAGGFQRGIRTTFYFDFPQILSITTGNTSIAYGGHQQEHSVRLYEEDAEMLVRVRPETIKRAYPKVIENVHLNYGSQYARTMLTGCVPGQVKISCSTIVKGRDVNATDIAERRKVCVLTERLARLLFQDSLSIGNNISVGDITYKVVGICKSVLPDDTSLGVYAPISTVLSLYRTDGIIDRIDLDVDKLDTKEANTELEKAIRLALAEKKKCSPNDLRAIQLENSYENVLQIQGVLEGIGFFVWVIGIATLLAGIVGVSNIMLITVKERTRELGVRKAMGASNASVIRIVLLESIVITMIFGYIGMMAGIGLTQLLDMALGSVFPMFQNPTVQFWPVMICNLMMVIAGIIAGYVPARRATRIKLVEALMG